jgi:hypothetical protein
MEDHEHDTRPGQQGFALILAILSLMLLTFLGLTLATSTSTELQIATNYRWSQQAEYNAQAGLEAGRVMLAQVAVPTTQWAGNLYPVRTGVWNPGAAVLPTVVPPGGTGRDFDHASCDTRGGVGYGLVLTQGATRYENVSSFGTQSVNGAFTVWVRRGLIVDVNGRFTDDPANDNLIIVSEGVAPYVGPADAFIRAHQAVRVLETTFQLSVSPGNPCGVGMAMGQEGGSPRGDNFNPCALMTDGLDGTLAGQFGPVSTGAEAGTLAGTSNR